MEENKEQFTAEQIKEAEKERFMQELQARAEQLSKENNGAEVIPVYYIDPVDPINGTPIVGFLKEPNRMTKTAIADEITKSPWRGNLAALQACLMKDVSDPRLSSDKREYDAIALGAGETAAQFVRIAINQLKKK